MVPNYGSRMKDFTFVIFEIILIVSILFLHPACTPTVTNLQTVEVSGPTNGYAIPITDHKQAFKPDIRLSVSVNNSQTLDSRLEGHTDVNAEGVFEVEEVPGEIFYLERAGVNVFPFDDDNFLWITPKWQTQVELDLPLSNHFALSGGFSYAAIEGQDFWGYQLGMGIFGEGNSFGWRLDSRLNFQETHFQATLVRAEDIPLTGDRTRRVMFFDYQKKDSYSNGAFLFTLNSRRPDWPLNLFLNYTLGSQTLFDARTEIILFHLNRDAADFKYTETYHSVALGVYKNIHSGGRFLLGMRITHYTDENSRLTIPNAFLQYDLTLW